MPIEIKMTNTIQASKSILVYGGAGSGKTRQISTAPNPMVISTDQGLSSLKDLSLPYVEIKQFSEIAECYVKATQDPQWRGNIQTIFFDDLTELAQIYIDQNPDNISHGLQLYGKMADNIVDLIRKWRVIDNYFIVFNCKQKRIQDESTGAFLQMPMIPGKKVTPELPHLVSEVWHLEDGTDQNGQRIPVVRTKRNEQIEAKSRSNLSEIEPANFTYLFQKMMQS